MSYCRFQNTLNDLEDCFVNMNNTSDLSIEEFNARKEIIKLAQQINEEFRDEEIHFDDEENE